MEENDGLIVFCVSMYVRMYVCLVVWSIVKHKKTNWQATGRSRQ